MMITEVMKISEPPYTNRGVTRQKEDLTALIDWCQIKTIAVIAEETGLKESTVKSKLLRGRKKLKLKMEKKGFRYEDCKIFFE